MRTGYGLPIAMLLLFLAGAAALSHAQPDAALYPFDPLPVEVLRASPRKVIAHYHCPFPLSINNRPEEHSYYATQFLTPSGEGGKHHRSGGYLRQRAYPVPVVEEDGVDRLIANAEHDIRHAVAAGIDGFVVNFVTAADSPQPHYRKAYAVLEAAACVDPGFRILPSPDCVCQWKQRDVDLFVEFVGGIYEHPAVWRFEGRPALAPWGANFHPPAFWREVLSALEAAGLPVAFFPCGHGTRDWLADAAPLCTGLMDSAVCSSHEAALGALSRNHAGRAHGLGIEIFAQTVRPQDGRPKANCYWEAANTRQYRTSWQVALEQCGPQDWVQYFTWNDHGEFSGVQPATGVQHLFHDLGLFYTTWLKTGRQPEIVRDMLCYCHRTQSTDAEPDLERQTRGPWRCVHKDPVNEIELLAFLAEPGTLQIEIGGETLGVFVDGVRIGTASGEGRALLHGSSPLVIGAGLRGWLDEVRIYDRPLTDAEVEVVYLRQAPGGQ